MKPTAPPYLFTISLIEDEHVGKTSIIRQFAENRFDVAYKSTIGLDFFVQMVEINGKAVKVNLWDVGGSRRYVDVSRLATAIRRWRGFILVFDATNLKSFTSLRTWIEEAEKQEDMQFNQAPRILVANKVDLLDQQVVEPSIAQNFAEEHVMTYMETSAKLSFNIEQLISSLSSVSPKNQTILDESLNDIRLSSGI
ncbi:P-loop containing nucleoside triphosphate hydrolase protein [Serendipita vermifera]|nr:P-loop containing nucleoside triphosphate hydrolase protein [Serendipita vermifera]